MTLLSCNFEPLVLHMKVHEIMVSFSGAVLLEMILTPMHNVLFKLIFISIFWSFYVSSTAINPFTPESDQCQNSPAASQEIWHHTVWRTWLFIAYSDERWLYYKFSLHHAYNCFLKGWENTLFELRSERVKNGRKFVVWTNAAPLSNQRSTCDVLRDVNGIAKPL